MKREQREIEIQRKYGMIREKIKIKILDGNEKTRVLESFYIPCRREKFFKWIDFHRKGDNTNFLSFRINIPLTNSFL